MFGQIGGQQGTGGVIPNSTGGENFIRHIGNDKLIFDFHEGSGTTVRDKSHNNNDGVFGAGAAAPTWKRNSLYFDGGGYVDLTGINHGISTGEFTFCFDVDKYTEGRTILDFRLERTIVRALVDVLQIYISGYKSISDTGFTSISPNSFQITRDGSGNLEAHINGVSQDKGQSNSGIISYDGISQVRLGRDSYDKVPMTTILYSLRFLN